MEPLHIPKGKKWKGLKVYCYKCNTNVTDICKSTLKPIDQCRFGDKHSFKIYVSVPGTKNERKTKKLETRNINEAIRLSMAFEREVKENKNLNVKIESQDKGTTKKENEKTKPELLIHCCAKFLGWMKNENVPSHLQRERSNSHVLDAERAFKVLLICLKENGYDVSNLKIQEIDDTLVGIVYEYLLKNKGFGNRNFNKYFSFYGRLLAWYSDEYNEPIRNCFSKVQRRKTYTDPQAISKEEFNDLLKQITPENGIREYHTGIKPYRNFYRPFLKDGFRLALLTGRRREEVISLKFQDIINEKDGFSYIKVKDYKVNKIQNRIAEEEQKYIYIPLTRELQNLLNELGYEKYKGTDKYILAPGIINKRNRSLADDLTRGFSHYYNQLGTGRNLTFKSMRKSYISSLSVFLGGNAKAITKHGDDEVIEKYYMDKRIMLKSANGFEVFNTETERKNELQEIRKENLGQEKSIEK